ncbi:TonB-dependent receptor domain-containing protein [Shewanella sp.]|uniref:TonB-dependent receptor domain-containing protein n=1 Tax=Shewanella sp. TaxID=50422 RepID=UPI003A97ACE7
MRTNKFPLSIIALTIMGITSPSLYAAGEDDIEVQSSQNPSVAATNDKTAKQSVSQPKLKADERILVTGSRLQNGNIVNKTTIITEQDIKERGVTSVEELIRTLPQNLATIGGMANTRLRGPLGVADGSARNMSSIGALGVSAANLGGMGAGRTLILVNGRRMAGAAGIQDGFVNLNGIPLSAVERVEITTDGASAVYGADAMGGVINFILKSGYSGTTVTVQHEDSNNGADNSRFSLYSGKSWTSGNVSITLDYSKRKPIINAKTGYVTNNYAPYFNDDPYYDRRSFGDGNQPAFIDNSISNYNPTTGTYDTLTQAYTVPAGFTGQPTMDDMMLVGGDARRDFVPRIAGPDTESKSVTLSFEQRLTEHLTINGNGLFTRLESSQNQIDATALSVNMAPGQAYNPFPAYALSSFTPGVTAAYYPADELASGELPYGYSDSTNDSWSANLGLTYEISDDTKLDFIYTTSRSTTSGSRYGYDSIVNINEDSTSPNGWSCYNFDLSRGIYTGDELAFYQDLFNRQCTALTSADPNIAFNPWKSSADGSGGSINDFYYRHSQEQRGSRLENYELRLTGALFELPAGKISYAIGGEYNDDGVNSREISAITGPIPHRTRKGYFAETSIPVFGSKFNFPMMKSLTFSLALRRDEYSTEGVVGTVDGVNPDLGGEFIYGKNTFGRNTPSYGFNWQPTDELTLRAKWTEGFRAPPNTELFSVTGTMAYSTTISGDPLYDCREHDDCDVDYGGSYYGYDVLRTTAPNPDLQPETSKQRAYTLSWYPKGFLSGLTLDVTYNNTKIKNEYENTGELIRLLPQDEVYLLEQYYPRDENGKITEMRNMTFNLSGSEYSSVIYDLGYFINTSFGTFEPKITYLNNLKADRQSIAGNEPVSNLGTLQGVDDYKLTGSLRYSYGDLVATAWAYYTPSYLNDYETIMSAGTITNPTYIKEVGSMTTYDLTLSYQLTPDLHLNFAGRNIFDTKPPFVVVGQLPYDSARYNVAGRTLSLELQYEF